MSDYTTVDIMDVDGNWTRRACADCVHVKVFDTGEFVTVMVCHHPKSGGRFTAYQARYDELRCGHGGQWWEQR